jgi:3-oxoacyl-[acyl-carrier-protein] synthase-3
VESGAHSKVLVIGADTMSSIIDYTDRATCTLFGDRAGAVLIEPAEENELGLIDFTHEIDGSGAAFLCMPGGEGLHPATSSICDDSIISINSKWTAACVIITDIPMETRASILRPPGNE